MKIGILGSGAVGQALGGGFAALGHEVKLGTREPWSEKPQAWATRTGPKASVGSFRDAAAFAEVAILATLWSGTENALKIAGTDNLKGKVVIDATNPLAFDQGGPPRLALGHKCFNIVGNAHMVKPQFPGGPPDMFICGNDGDAKQTVDSLVRSLGWPPAIDIGRIEGARLLEPLCILWVVYGARTNTWNHAFKLLRR